MMQHHDITAHGDLSHITTLRDKVTASCGHCGVNWEYQRHEALQCPYCAATFTHAYMSPVSPSYVHLEADGPAGASGQPAR